MTFLIANFLSMSFHSIEIPLDIHSEHSTLFLTISRTKMFTNYNHKSLRTKIHFQTSGHISGVRNDLRRKVSHPTLYSKMSAIGFDKHLKDTALNESALCDT
jgi:hypothetical protein